MHGSFAIFNVSTWFRCDGKFGGVGGTKHSHWNVVHQITWMIRCLWWVVACKLVWNRQDSSQLLVLQRNRLYCYSLMVPVFPVLCVQYLNTICREFYQKNGDYKNCMFLSDGSWSPIQELDHNGTFLRKENQSSKLNYIYQYPVWFVLC